MPDFGLPHHLMSWLERMRARYGRGARFLLERQENDGVSLRASDAGVWIGKPSEARLPQVDRNPPHSDVGAGGSRSRVPGHYSSATSPH